MASAQATKTRPTRTRRSAQQTREVILSVAGELFYQQGIRSTGVDTVAAHAGIAPPTLYRLFASKDELVAAYVDQCSESYRSRLTAASEPETGTPRQRILAVFDTFIEEVTSNGCRGCPFLLVLAEYPDPDNLVHQHAVAHKTWLRKLFHALVADLAKDVPMRDADGLGEHLALIAEGIYGSVQALGAAGPARQGRACAAALLDAACA